MGFDKKPKCKYFNKADSYCDKTADTVTERNCQTCRFYTTDQKPQKKRAAIEPDDLWRKKKAKDKDRRTKQQMIEDLENEDG